jgi:FtsP/CotA-like multicopper oxidase with cupredoxin domain
MLVKADREPGQYRLLNQPFNPAQGMMGGGMMGGGMMGGSPRNTTTETVATLTYRGTIEPLSLPDQLIAVEPLPEPQTTRQYVLNHDMGMVFLINGKAFDHHRIDTQIRLNTVEDWEVSNTGTMTRPFHVHTNKFQVISRNGQPSPLRRMEGCGFSQPWRNGAHPHSFS